MALIQTYVTKRFIETERGRITVDSSEDLAIVFQPNDEEKSPTIIFIDQHEATFLSEVLAGNIDEVYRKASKLDAVLAWVRAQERISEEQGGVPEYSWQEGYCDAAFRIRKIIDSMN